MCYMLALRPVKNSLGSELVSACFYLVNQEVLLGNQKATTAAGLGQVVEEA